MYCIYFGHVAIICLFLALLHSDINIIVIVAVFVVVVIVDVVFVVVVDVVVIAVVFIPVMLL